MRLELLVNNGDTFVLSVERPTYAGLFSVEENTSRIRGVDASKNLHHRRFAGTVFTDERVPLRDATQTVRRQELAHRGTFSLSLLPQ